MFSKLHRTLAAWVIYDMAAHAYALMIPAVGYAIYFTSFIAASHPLADGLWAIAVALPLVTAGLISPWLGVLADSGGYRRRFLILATIICSIATALMTTSIEVMSFWGCSILSLPNWRFCSPMPCITLTCRNYRRRKNPGASLVWPGD